MSDVAATNCGCDNNGCGNSISNGGGFGGNSILWIIILLCFCGNGCGNNGCGNGFGGDNCCILIVLLLLCGCGNGNGYGNNGCGCSLC